MATVRVELEERSYPIIIESGIISTIGRRLKEMGLATGKAAVVTNPLIKGLYGDKVVESLKAAGIIPAVITIPDGEEYKTLKEASAIYDGLIEHRLERSSPIVALGGGVIGDVAGFVAATYLRGVPYIQVPTTLLAQVDSSVGGKTAVNHPKGKNLIGAFYQPKAVFIDPEALKTLDQREFRAGLAEVVKYGVIWDKEFFKFLEDNHGKLLKPGGELTRAIERSCAIKAKVVEADETETGLRSILNFGHTFGHAIENLAGYGTFKHGEAVSIGMIMASDLSVAIGACGKDASSRIKGLLSALGLSVIPPEIPAPSFIESMRLDKKVVSARIRFVLLSEIGKVFLRDVTEDELNGFLRGYYKRP